MYIGEDGSETYFKESGKTCCCDSGTQCYNLYEAVSDSDMLYDPQQKILTTGADTLFFDDDGRLTAVEDAYGNRMTITFTSGRITSVTGRRRQRVRLRIRVFRLSDLHHSAGQYQRSVYLFGQPTHGDDISGR